MVCGAEQYPRGVLPRRMHCCAMEAGEECPRAGVAAITQSQSRATNRRTELLPLTRRPRNSSTFVLRVNERLSNTPACDCFEQSSVFQSGLERQLAPVFGVYPNWEGFSSIAHLRRSDDGVSTMGFFEPTNVTGLLSSSSASERRLRTTHRKRTPILRHV